MSELLLLDVDVLLPGRRIECSTSILIRDGIIASFGVTPDEVRSARVVQMGGSCMASPGLVDLQVNGAMGVNFDRTTDTRGLEAVVRYHMGAGTLGGLPTIVDPELEATRALAVAISGLDIDLRGWVAGVHLEGPFIDAAESGVLTATLAYDRDLLLRLAEPLEELGVPVVVTLSPNVVSPTQIEDLVARGFIVSIGHADLSGSLLQQSIDAGASLITHVSNCFGTPKPRHDSGLWTALQAEIATSIISDGVHSSTAFARLLAREKRPGHLVVVSDSSPVAGCGEGDTARLGGVDVVLRGGLSVTSEGKLAGGTHSLLQCAQWLMQGPGVSRPDALEAASVWASDIVGVPRNDIRIGAAARFVVCDSQLNLVGTVVGDLYVPAAPMRKS